MIPDNNVRPRLLTLFIDERPMSDARPPVMENPSHIVPVRCPLMGPTVPRGMERTRFAPTSVQSDAQISDVIAALKELWVACPVGKGQYIKLAAE